MRRADRLLQILLLLRGRTCTTAQQLAEWLEISVRTVYRDINDLMLSGAPVNGEAGRGYWLEEGFTPPPLSFSLAELQALEVGARMLSAWTDAATAEAAASALSKVHGVLGSAGIAAPPLFAPNRHNYPVNRLSELTEAINTQSCLAISYADEAGRESQRTIAPLGLFFWGYAWTIAAWCHLRQAYRHFRVDRLRQWQGTDTAWPATISLDAFLENAQASESARQAIKQQGAQAWHQPHSD